MDRIFRTRVHLFALDKRLLAEADCVLTLHLEFFAPIGWSGSLSGLRPVAPALGRYLMRFPNGRVREVEVTGEDFAGCEFQGFGDAPMP